MNYSDNPAMVRVDFWKPSGKWYCTEAIKWDRYITTIDNSTETIHETFKRCLREQLGDRLSDMTATCLEPYHEHSHPLMIKNWFN